MLTKSGRSYPCFPFTIFGWILKYISAAVDITQNNIEIAFAVISPEYIMAMMTLDVII